MKATALCLHRRRCILGIVDLAHIQGVLFRNTDIGAFHEGSSTINTLSFQCNGLVLTWSETKDMVMFKYFIKPLYETYINGVEHKRWLQMLFEYI